MLISVLGPLRVMARDEDEPIVISAARLRALLAVLLWRVNQPVPVDLLAELIWDGTPPDGTAAVRTLVKRLRQVLGEDAGARIVTRAPGYLILLSDDELDASRFETLRQGPAQPPEPGGGRRLGARPPWHWGCGVVRRWRTSPRSRFGISGFPTWSRRGCRCWSGGSKLTCMRGAMSS